VDNNDNQLWLAALLARSSSYVSASGITRDRINKILDATESVIAPMIREVLRGDIRYTSDRLARALTLLKRIRVVRSEAWNKADRVFEEDFIGFMEEERTFLSETLNGLRPGSVTDSGTLIGVLFVLAQSKPFEGRSLQEWLLRLRMTDLQQFENQIRIGLVQNESSDDITRRIVGTRTQNGRDGAVQLTRKSIQTMAVTSMGVYGDAVREDFFVTNSGMFLQEIFVPVVDDRTTVLCLSLERRVFPVGQGPIPPLHWNCRSKRFAILI
jgi:hypothetical protein